MSKKETFVAFLKKNGLYLAIAFTVLVVAIIGAVALFNGNKSSVQTFKPASSSLQTSSPSSSIGGVSSSGGTTNSSGGNSSEVLPTVITFIMPVENGEIIKEYTEDTVVFNQTLGVYSAHLAVDIAGQEGAKVYCPYNGTIESIETSYLLGAVITINHGDGLKTVYSSLEVAEDLAVGQKLTQGEELGVIATTNRQEYKDGAHLHFEVLKNGEKVNPVDFIVMPEDK